MAARPLAVLAFETSCDETAAAVVRRHPDGRGEILSNVVLSQLEEHRLYGGVVPEIAARSHISRLDTLARKALSDAGVDRHDVDAIAATAGPGLLGGLLVGLVTAKAMAIGLGKPLVAVNHLEAHALTPGLTDGLRPPYLLLLVSGGHTQTVAVEEVGIYTRYGTTIDDALGEAFDKTAKLLGLDFPGGPAVERLATHGRGDRFAFPRPLKRRDDCHFSFSGLKTAVRVAAEELPQPLSETDAADICASFQAAAIDVVTDRVRHAMERYAQTHRKGRVLVVAGGVAANRAMRAALERLCETRDFRLSVPPPALCTDNAAMVAWAACERLARGITSPLSAPAHARWPLDELAPKAPYAGVKA
ncbi:MAG: tRNA (adenosine(37)-N6)-threonylcarbamoyltransferase complex transferase subunit TsaD [Hyphomicrobiales bacterium]